MAKVKEPIATTIPRRSSKGQVVGYVRVSTLGLAQQRYLKSHRNVSRFPRSGPHPGRPYRTIRVTGVGRPRGFFAFVAGNQLDLSVRETFGRQVGEHLMPEQMWVDRLR